MSISRHSALIVVAIGVLALVLLLFVQSFLLRTVVAAGGAFAVSSCRPRFAQGSEWSPCSGRRSGGSCS